MKILMINSVCGIKSTGRICTDLAEELTRRGNTVKIAYGRENVPKQYQKFAVRIGNNFDVYTHALISRIFDNSGFASRKKTEIFMQWVQNYDPDLIHLHNLHGYYINLKTLFQYLRFCGKRVIWTLHDCWPFTGHCTHFDYVKCDKWKTGCYDCIQKESYPKSIWLDYSEKNYEEKKRLFAGIPNLMLVAPSQWLANLVQSSFLKEYDVRIIHNGIDMNVFRPTPSNLRQQLGIGDKRVILGVASTWSKRKGLADLMELKHRLGEEYQLVLVGIDEKEKRENHIDSDIITIQATNSQTELAQYYTMADIFVNPTYEDNYPTVNLEAIACGTPVISYDTGGSGESAARFGMTVPKGDIKALRSAIVHVDSIYDSSSTDFSRERMVAQYIGLYNEKHGR